MSTSSEYILCNIVICTYILAGLCSEKVLWDFYENRFVEVVMVRRGVTISFYFGISFIHFDSLFFCRTLRLEEASLGFDV